MKNTFRNKKGSIMVETALAIPMFLMVIFTLVEVGRAMYVLNTLDVAAQRVASLIGTNAARASTYNVSTFSQYADQVRIPGSVISSSQFSFDVRDALNNGTVVNGQASSATSTKVVVTVNFPPPGQDSYKIPVFDPGLLIGIPIFGPAGLPLSSSATCFLERSRRPTI